jgi:hypothetical protein
MPLRFDKKKYSDEEMVQMEAVQRFYKHDISETLHQYLLMSPDEPTLPRYTPSPVDFQRATFQGTAF